MSIASKVGQVTFSQKSGVYMPAIMCDKGDLYQEYDGDATSPTAIAPDFTPLKPTLSFILTSSRVAEGVVVPSSVKWYFNDLLLSFSSNLSTNSLGGETGHFKNIPYAAGSTDYYGLQILKNLVKASDGASCTIRCEATVSVGNTSDTIQFVYTIPITKGVGNQTVVTITAGDGNYFCIREKGGACKLTAMVRQGAGEITSGLTYKWYNQVNGAWSQLSGQTGKTLTVSDTLANGGEKSKISWRLNTNASAEILDGGRIKLSMKGREMIMAVNASVQFELKIWPNDPPEDYDAPNGDSRRVGFEAFLAPNESAEFSVSLTLLEQRAD